MADLVGQQISLYRLTRRLSQGTLADVYLAEHIRTQRQVAIKIMHASLTEDKIGVFRQDVEKIAKLTHFHIIPILHFGIYQNERPFLVQRYASRGSLREQHPPGSKLSLDLIVGYVEQIADALQYAYRLGHIHGNLKPENILGTDDKILLSDFSMATVNKGTEKLNQIETALYAAPELIQNEPTHASDQYALAAMIYEWICGDPPFQGSPLQVIQQHIHEDPPSLREKIPELSRELEWILMTALAKHPEQRFKSIQAFARAFSASCKEMGYVYTESTRVFFSYAQRDQNLRDQLENHLSNLKYRGLITTWNVREIKAGENVIQQTNIHLNAAHIILLLISANFLASDYCYSQEMMQAIQRHRDGKAHVIPVLLRPVVFTDAPFAKLEPLPTNRKPVVTWRNRDSAFVDIAMGIESIVLERRQGISLETIPYMTAIEDIEDIEDIDIAAPGGPPPSQSTPPVSRPGLPLTPEQQQRMRELNERRKADEEKRKREWEDYYRKVEEAHLRAIQASGLSRPEYEYYDQALQAYKQAIYEDRNDAAAYRGKGLALAALKRYNEALLDFKQAQQLMPLPATYVSMGDVLAALGRWNEAVDAYNQALTLDASSATAYAGLSEALAQLGRTQEAEEASAQAKQLGLED
ncbi:protein kinase domain-containing protein [Dictyobacter formicarum]|uniref:Protein kinase domain-containing protein n=1 Tax=Dictyobacter formicarum TaxID=2778368 RepID=A0ABQ3VTD5_9CHLR|nr:protein kinase [Dictyobacter formicarum]GHO89210.1 hypothetical protein KSZ_72160 [Dictyobacter formicarum]